jgi:hypothetical protein
MDRNSFEPDEVEQTRGKPGGKRCGKGIRRES